MLDEDGLPLDDVGIWTKEKHTRLRRYVDITWGVRKRWVEGSGGATYIDLFCGSGRAVVRETGERIDGSPVVAFKTARDCKVPFSKIYIADESETSVSAAQQRLTTISAPVAIETGRAADTAHRIAEHLNKHGLHLVFLDPFSLEGLPFSVIQSFSTLKHVDMLIHISAQDLQRNLDRYSASVDSPLDLFAPGWRDVVDLKQRMDATRAAYIKYWVAKIEGLGFPPGRFELIVGSRNQRLYWLVLISRHPRAAEFWDKIRNISGQGELL
ncbi:MAG: three-Cys-motif partner protein TcmP [Methyloceanibacter sp.]